MAWSVIWLSGIFALFTLLTRSRVQRLQGVLCHVLEVRHHRVVDEVALRAALLDLREQRRVVQVEHLDTDAGLPRERRIDRLLQGRTVGTAAVTDDHRLAAPALTAPGYETSRLVPVPQALRVVAAATSAGPRLFLAGTVCDLSGRLSWCASGRAGREKGSGWGRGDRGVEGRSWGGDPPRRMRPYRGPEGVGARGHVGVRGEARRRCGDGETVHAVEDASAGRGVDRVLPPSAGSTMRPRRLPSATSPMMSASKKLRVPQAGGLGGDAGGADPCDGSGPGRSRPGRGRPGGAVP